MITENCSVEQLAGIENDHPSLAATRYVVVQHHDLLREIQRQVTLAGASPGECQAGISYDEAECILAVEVTDHGLDFNDDMGLFVGIVNSNGRRRASCMYSGLLYKDVVIPLSKFRVLIHDSRVYKLSAEIGRVIDNFVVQWPNFPNRLLEMKLKAFERVTADACIMRAGRQQHLAWSRFRYVEAERKLFKQETAWSLYYSMAQAVYRNKPIVSGGPYVDQFSQLWGIREILMEV